MTMIVGHNGRLYMSYVANNMQFYVLWSKYYDNNCQTHCKILYIGSRKEYMILYNYITGQGFVVDYLMDVIVSFYERRPMPPLYL